MHRPYRNLVSLLKGNGIRVNNLYFIDAASSQAKYAGKAKEKLKTPEKKTERCVNISRELNVDELVRAIYTSLPRIKAKNKFVFLDSITTLTLYQPLSETLRFGEFLTRTLKSSEITGVVVNVAETLAQKKFVQEIVMHCDEVIKVK